VAYNLAWAKSLEFAGGSSLRLEAHPQEAANFANPEKPMSITELLLVEFDEESKQTRVALERVPADKKEFTPHAKSMPLGKLAPHVAGLNELALIILTAPEYEFAKGNRKPLQFESSADLVRAWDESAAKVRSALQSIRDGAWNEDWKLMFEGKSVFKGSRFLAYRRMYMNHLVHHRAQLGVYLRLNNLAVPATFGPSADDRLGF
jgi:uncharacterized damage-inducible protein DinB